MDRSGKRTFSGIDEYIAIFPKDIQKKLKELRKAIHEAAPEAEETISYGMPAFRKNKVLVYFAAAKNHIGFYPTASPVVEFEKELAKFKHSKGAIQFPLDEPMPLDLVRRIVEFRVKEDGSSAKKRPNGKRG